MKKLIILLLSIAFSGLLIWNTSQRALQEAYFAEYNSAARTLREQQSAVSRELDEVNQRLKEVVIGKGCISFVFTDLTEQLYREAAPILTRHGWTGTLALSPDHLPGEEGMLTLSHCEELADSGWGLCLCWDDYRTLEDSTEAIRAFCGQSGLAQPDTLYVESGSYFDFKDSQIQDCGFTTVIHHGESGTELVAREDRSELFQIGALAWNTVGVKSIVEACGQYGGSLVLYLDFSTDYGLFDRELFEKMCDFLASQQELLSVTDLAGARENLSMVETDEYLTARRDYLEKEIQRYEEEIAAIYQLNLEQK